MNLINNHTHSCFSHDGKGSIEDICEEALRCRLAGFAITDHCDCEYADDINIRKNLMLSFEETKKAKFKYASSLIISCGIEIGEAIFNPGFEKMIISSKNWDVILGSVHAVRYENFDMPFSRIDFSASGKDFIKSYLNQYFNDMLFMISNSDFDILSHLTVPLRYINGRYNKNIDITEFYPVIEKILKETISREKTLEINTSGNGDLMFFPDENIISLYKSLGGEKISIGSDSHTPSDLTHNIEAGAELLKEKGFDKLSYFIDRKEFFYNI